jgi:spermidine/putrescine transport system permease protein
MPASVWLAVLLAAPLVVILYYSFLTPDIVTGGVILEFTLDNYIATLGRSIYGMVFIRTVGFASVATGICLLLGYALAYWIVRYTGRWKILALFIVIIPSWTNDLIRLYAMRSLTQSGGAINSILLRLGLISSPLEMLYTPEAVQLGLVYTLLPFMILPIYSALDGLDPSLLEAADDLGATRLQKFLTVTLPLTKAGIIAGAILVFVPSLGAWLVPLLLGGAKILMAGNLVQLHFLAVGNIPMGCCVGAVLTVAILLIVALAMKLGGEEALERIV